MNSADRSVISLLPPPSLPRFLPRRRHPTDRARRLVYLSLFAPPFLIFLPLLSSTTNKNRKNSFSLRPHAPYHARLATPILRLFLIADRQPLWNMEGWRGRPGSSSPPLLLLHYHRRYHRQKSQRRCRSPTRQSLVVVRYTGGNKWQKLNIFCLSKSLL